MAAPTPFLRDRRGAAAAEFALVLPAFIFFTLGAINLSTLLFAMTSLHQAAEGAARYSSVTTAANGVDPGQAAVCAWAVNHYKGPGGVLATTCAGTPPPFVYTASPTAGCAHVVTAAGSYTLYAGFLNKTFPLNATACFP